MEKNKAEDVLKNHQSGLKDVIVAAGVVNIVNLCEEKGLIAAAAKDDLVSSYTGKTENERAYQLLDIIRKSLAYNTSTVLDKFLCIIYNEGGVAGQGIAKELSGECELLRLETFIV